CFIPARCLACLALLLFVPASGRAQGGHPIPSPPPPGVKERKCRKDRKIPILKDVTQESGIRFEHLIAPEQHYILESMRGGRLQQRWPAVHLCDLRRWQRALSQQWRWYFHGCDRESRRRGRSLVHRRRIRRL